MLLVHSQHHSLNVSMMSPIYSPFSNRYLSMTFSVLPVTIVIHPTSNRPLHLSYTTLIQFSLLSSTQLQSLPCMIQLCRCSLCWSRSALIPSFNTPCTTAAINTPSPPFSTLCNNSMTPPNLPTTIPPLMMTLAYGLALMHVLVITP